MPLCKHVYLYTVHFPENSNARCLSSDHTRHADAYTPCYKSHPCKHFHHSSRTQSSTMASKFVLALSLSLLVCGAFAETCRTPQLTAHQQCRLNKINAAQPTQRIQSEGGVIELWDERADQFQCAGVAPMRTILKPNGLSLPNYHPSPRLVFIERGQGWISITFPGCFESYHSPSDESIRQGSQGQQQEQEADLHQKLHRIRKGDIVALPAGAAHWCFNDGNEELVAVSINDLNHKANQLDQNFRAFYLAGGVPRSEQGQDKFQNILRALDPQLLAESYNVPQQLVQQMQSAEEERGLSVIVKEPMRFVKSDEPEEYEQQQQQPGQTGNSLAEGFCTMKIKTNVENRLQADIHIRGAGKVYVADSQKLPILQHMDISLERGHLYPNAFMAPFWEQQGHVIMYATRGDARVTIVNHMGQALMNDRVNHGGMFVIPQFHISNVQAGSNGFEFVAFKISGMPMGGELAGYTSVIRAMPLEVLTNAYQISPKQAQALKMNRGGQSVLLSPGRIQSQRQD